MPDKRQGHDQLIHPAFVFVAEFSDGCAVQLAIDQAFESEETATAEAKRYVQPLGKLPTSLRSGVKRVVIHKGGRDTTAFSDVGLMVLYSDNATKRISNHDLEETVFHESVHASWDKKHAKSEGWKRAQAQDGKFVTLYGKRKPEREDLAESALFAYTLIHHPERIPADEAKKIKSAIPARIRFVEELLPVDKPIFYAVEKRDIESADAKLKKPDQKNALNATSDSECKVDISSPGQLGDIISNALLQELNKDEAAVRKFLDSAQTKATTAEELFQMTLVEFTINEQELKSMITKYLHCNCEHDSDSKSDEDAKQVIAAWKATTDKD
jgi:hypothetical protein